MNVEIVIYSVSKINVYLPKHVDFGDKNNLWIKILALHGQHNLPTLIQSQKMLVRLKAILESAKRPRRSKLHCAH